MAWILERRGAGGLDHIPGPAWVDPRRERFWSLRPCPRRYLVRGGLQGWRCRSLAHPATPGGLRRGGCQRLLDRGRILTRSRWGPRRSCPVCSSAVRRERLTSVLLVIAAGIPLSSYWTIASARLTVDLRFRTLAGINTAISLIRSVLVVLFALAGFGPLSFALPLLVGHLFASAAGFQATHLIP